MEQLQEKGLLPDGTSFCVHDLAHNFGTKSIGYLAGCILLINNITGPGIPALPNLFAEAGWLFPMLCILAIWVMTATSASMYCEAMRKIPGNEHFKDRIEYSSIMRYYFSNRGYAAAQLGLNGALQALNIISVAQSARVMDNAISAIFGKTCALNLTPYENFGSRDFLSCVDINDTSNGNEWGCHLVVTAGFALAAMIAIPFGRWNLDDNMVIQIVSFVFTLACWIIWILASLSSNEMKMIPAVNTEPKTGSQAAVLGTILFNFGFVTTVPSWVNEKRPQVSVNKSLWSSTFFCNLVFVAIGLSGAMAFQDVLQGPVSNTCVRAVKDANFNCPNDLMQTLTNVQTTPSSWRTNPTANFILHFSVYLFPIVAVLSSIPVFSIVIKYNVIENGFSARFGFLWGVVFPWVAAFPLLYMPDAINQFVNFTSLIVVTFTDFIIPYALYIKLQAMDQREDEGLDHPPAGVKVHYALPGRWRRSKITKKGLSVIFGFLLTTAAAIAIVQSIIQGTWDFNQQVCEAVGS
eukprot:gnl/MRDRNA2_/MRDRNA2_30737_c0_seq1.p1 gnl/MRDRNA2_/MRDRNA2_30737_c0~~gnl/MRDRNA2_/MRDRNA2_30737_c0_seq1.p1  ORF type:complete len:521 (-),score=65.24 gnl/MRDRNA2_/MRDRNA2_30737_c0_seq1:100-1662(-)